MGEGLNNILSFYGWKKNVVPLFLKQNRENLYIYDLVNITYVLEETKK